LLVEILSKTFFTYFFPALAPYIFVLYPWLGWERELFVGNLVKGKAEWRGRLREVKPG
jgi:hypothetical protein